MGRSTLISAALHTAILLFALVAFPAAKMDPAPLVAIPVDLATPSELTQIKAGTAEAKDDAPLVGKPKEQRPEAVKEASKPEEETAKADQPEDKPKPKEKVKAEAPKPEPKAEAKKQDEKPAKPRQAQAAAKKACSGHRQEARFQHRPDCRAAQQDSRRGGRSSASHPVDDAPPKKVHGQSNGTQMTMSVNEIGRAESADRASAGAHRPAASAPSRSW